jgi:MinD superfamily P-loop ATPase
MGIGVANPENIEQIGDRPDGFPLTDFDKPKSVTMMWNLPVWHPIRRFMENHMVTRPGIDPLSCKNCGVCSSHCPPQAIKEVRGVLKIDKKKCISCFCCHELCQNNAVQIIRPFWGKVISRVSKKIPI